MEITEMTLEDLEQMKNTLYSDFDNFLNETKMIEKDSESNE